MCEPISIGTGFAIASTAMGVGSTIASHKAQSKAAKANEKSARADMRLNQYDAGARQQEEMIAGTRMIEQGRRQGRGARAHATVSAAEAGVGGMSVDMLLGNMERDEAQYVLSVEDQTVVTLEQLQRVKQGATAQAESRIASVPRPSYLATGVSLLGQGIDLYSNLRLRKPPTTDKVNPNG